jgi:DNA-binding response OmpR family regulator
MVASSLFSVGTLENDVLTAAEAARRLGLSATATEYKPTTLGAIQRAQASVVVVDLPALPGGGEILCRQLARLPQPPLVLAIAADPSQAAAALQAGATVCLAQPVDPSWLAAQLSGLLRLSRAQEATGQGDAPLTIRGLKVDPRRCEASIEGRAIPLTPTEFRILACLARSPGLVVSGHDLVEEALGIQLPEQEAMELLKVHVYRLRGKLAQGGSDPWVLRNTRGFGYMLERRAAVAKPARAAAVAGGTARASHRRSA